MIAYRRLLEAFSDHGCIVDENRLGSASIQAPGHSPADRSVSVTAVEGRVLVYSHSDTTEDVLDQIGIRPSDLFDDPAGIEYKYGDGRVVRRTPDKRFFQHGNTSGTELFHVDRVANSAEVYFVEGEQDVLTLESVGECAVSGAGGGKNIKNHDLTPLHGRDVILVRDKDEIGEHWADTLWNSLAPNANSIRVVTALEGKDASDHIAAGYGVDQFVDDENFSTRMARKKLWDAWQDSKDANLADFVQVMESTLKKIKPPEPMDGKIFGWDETLDEWWEWYGAPEEQKRVIPTPWERVNETIAGGYQSGRLYLVAARPGVGKSLMLANSVLASAMAGFRSVVFSLEMGRIEVMSRMLADGATADYGQITKREMDEWHLTRVAQFSDDSRGQIPLLIADTPGLTLARLERYIETLANSPEGIDFVAVDYAQLIKAQSGLSDRQANVEISRSLKIMSRKFGVPILAAAQVNRDAAKEGKAADLTGIGGSDTYGQDADCVCVLSLEMTPGDNPMCTGTIFADWVKNRTGPVRTISLDYRPHYAKISN